MSHGIKKDTYVNADEATTKALFSMLIMQKTLLN